MTTAPHLQTSPDPSAPVQKPHPKFKPQHQSSPGLESELDPRPQWRGERYLAAGKLSGMVAIVTGGDSGIGRSVAYHYAREGADVVITTLPQERSDAHTTADAIEKLGRRCLVLSGDLSQPSFCEDVIKSAIAAFGKLNVLVHNAAWQNRKEVTEVSEQELDTTMKVNVYAFLRLARAAVPHMEAGSSIIATGSVVGLEGAERLSDYGATKGAIHAITKSLAHELSSKGIRVNCVAPGPVWTPLNPSDEGLSPDDVAEFGEGATLMDRPAQPDEVAPAYVYFASNADSGFVTGVVLPVTGKPA